MSNKLVGRKCGMTRVFTEAGESIPVTVLEISSNRISQIKNQKIDGYDAIQVTVGSKKVSRVSKSQIGHFAKAGVTAGSGIWEFRIEGSDEVFTVGQELTVNRFKVGQFVDVTGSSKGKGFQGGIKRHNFGMQDATHGNSVSHRAPGSIGQCQTPGRVWKGKKMAGHMGDAQITTQNLQVVKIDEEMNLILIKGAVPGATGGNVIIKSSVKIKLKGDSNEV